jgi:hypothetical protein
MIDFKVLEIRKIQKTDSDIGLVGFCDVSFGAGAVVIRNFRIIRSRECRILFGLPIQFYSEVAYRIVKKRAAVKLDEDLKSLVYGAILAEWNRMNEKINQEEKAK